MIDFYFNGSPNPTKVALFLEEAGLEFTPHPVDTRAGDQFKPDFLKINPNGKVPAIVDGETVVFDSNAILLYLAEKTGKIILKENEANFSNQYGAMARLVVFCTYNLDNNSVIDVEIVPK